MVPATQEAEVRGSLEPGRLRLQWAVIMPLHSILHDRVVRFDLVMDEQMHLDTDI